MREKERVLSELALPDPSGRYDLSQDTGEIVFTDKNGVPTVKARFEFAGMVSTRSGTWLWAWANSTLDERLTRAARKVRDYGEQRGFDRLTTARVSADAYDAQDLAAIAIKVTGAQAWYRAPLNE